MDKIVTYQFNFYQFGISIRNAVALILSSYQEKHTQGHKRTIALGFELHGGFILHDLKCRGVLAAAVVQMDHCRECENSTDDHHCAIIHYLSPFNEHLTTLWTMIPEYLRQASIICKTKYIYYAKVNKDGSTLFQKFVSKRDKFLRDYKFDLGDKTCHFDGGQFVASLGYWTGSKAQR